MRLSHLHLHSVQDDGNVYTLYLPQVVYLRLHMHLAWSPKQTSYVYPLDICVPKVTTLHIEGDVFYDYVYPLTEMILGAKATIVNFLSTLPLELFPWRALDQFPRLATFRFDSSIFFLPLSNDFSLLPRPSSSSLAFIMLELENHIEGSSLHSKDSYAHNFVDMFLRPGKWVDKVVVPFVWREMEDQWVKAYDTRNKTGRGKAALPCCWRCLRYIDRHNILIEDRCGVSLREGDGAAFAHRMETFWNETDSSESDSYQH